MRALARSSTVHTLVLERRTAGIRALSIIMGCMAFVMLSPSAGAAQVEEANKALARRFYEQVWFSRNTGAVDGLVAPHYVVHDIGGRGGVQEPASEQTVVAERFWRSGSMGGRIDFQIAEGDLVATRWLWAYEPRTWRARLLMAGGRDSVPIINVFRFEDGRIAEIWNHRHDIEVGFAANFLRVQGFLAGVLLLAFIGLILRVRRHRREGRDSRSTAADRSVPIAAESR